MQSGFEAHCTHVLPAHLGVGLEQLPSPMHWTQVAPEQIGLEPEQSLLATQPTHVLLLVLHVGVVPEQSALALHWTHVLFEHTRLPSVRAAQSASPMQPTQVPVPVLHAGVAPEQLLFPVHWTQVVPPEQIDLGAVHTLVQLPQWAAVSRATQVLPPQVSCPEGQPVAHDVASAHAYGAQVLVAGDAAAQWPAPSHILG